MTTKMSFCLQAAKLDDTDFDLVSDTVERYVEQGIDIQDAERLAVADALAALRNERKGIEALVAEQYPQAKTKTQSPVEQRALAETRKMSFKRFSEGHQVVMPEEMTDYGGGKPAVFMVYHGTTYGDITEVDTKRGQFINAMGPGFYTSTNVDDASANYAGVGRDLESNIDRLKERMIDDAHNDDYAGAEMLREFLKMPKSRIARATLGQKLGKGFDPAEIDDAELMGAAGEKILARAVEALATAKLKGDTDGFMMPLWVKTSRPFDTRANGLVLESGYEVDEDGEYVATEAGSEVETLIEAIRDVAGEFGANQRATDALVASIQDEAIDGVSASDILAQVDRAGLYASDPGSGDPMSPGAFLAEAARRAGYDAYIMDAFKAFPYMQAMGPGTAHVMPFVAGNIKSVFNQGTYDTSNKDILKSTKRLTDTAAFKTWFEGSRVVDASGKPLVVYHGTSSDFSMFDRVDAGNAYGPGFYFTEDPRAASAYATGSGGGRVRPEGNAGPNVRPVYLRAKDLFVMDDRLLTPQEIGRLESASNTIKPGSWEEGTLAKAFDRAYRPTAQNVMQYIFEQTGARYTAVAQTAGFDGLKGAYGYVVFGASQIKSVFNDGSFGPSGDISKSTKRLTNSLGLDIAGGDKRTQENFDNWFAKSVMVDDQGRPLVLWHGTDAEFRVFKPSEDGAMGPGIYVAGEVEMAQGYGENTLPLYVRIQKPLILRGDGKTELGREIIKDKAFVDANFNSPGQARRWLENEFEEYGGHIGDPEFRQMLRDAGYDGIVRYNADGSVREAMALSPLQLKSVANSGEYGSGLFSGGDIYRSTKRNVGNGVQKFYSALAEEIEALPTKAANADGWKAAIKGLVNKGKVKQDEIFWSGIEDWLDAQDGKVSKEQLSAFLGDNGVRVEETDLNWEDAKDDIEARVESRMDDLRRELEEELAKRREKYEVNARGEFYSDLTVREEDVEDDEGNVTTQYFVSYYREDVAGPFDTEAEAEETRDEMAGDEEEEYIREVMRNFDNDQENEFDPDGDVEYRVRREAEDDFDGDFTPQYARWTLPGGEGGDSYRELLVTLPKQSRVASSDYGSSHWAPVNVLAHVRLRDDVAGATRVLFVEELQSDWAQDGRKKGFQSKDNFRVQEDRNGLFRLYRVFKDTQTGEESLQPLEGYDPETGTKSITAWSTREAVQQYIDSGMAQRYSPSNDKSVPRAPFVEKTDGWLNLALKRVLISAVEGNYQRVAFVTGKQSADRYNLAKQVDLLSMDAGFGGYTIAAYKNTRELATRTVKDEAEAAGMVGKEIAAKLFKMAKEDDHVELTGVDLEIGGEGMKAFYDAIVPKATEKLISKLGGGKVAPVVIKGNPQLSFEVTPEMKEKVSAGLPLFSTRRAYHGTPHRGIDKFSTDKIGTGEGAQAYGWGLYFASKREIAEYYRTTLTERAPATLDGVSVDDLPTAEKSAVRMVQEAGGNVGAALRAARADMMVGGKGAGADFHADRVNTLFDISKGKRNLETTTGQLYEVEIPEDSEMLLWDKPLSEQPEGARKALSDFVSERRAAMKKRERIYTSPVDEILAKQKGSDWYSDLSGAKGSDKAASEYLSSLGIKGIKYLDGSSRAGGEGSYNFVVFSDDDVAIRQTFYSTRRNTDGAAFKKWFGKSKAVDEDGEPLVVYHGSNEAGFTVFDTDGKGKTRGTGAFFTSDYRMASGYQKGRAKEAPLFTPQQMFEDPEQIDGLEINEGVLVEKQVSSKGSTELAWYRDEDEAREDLGYEPEDALETQPGYQMFTPQGDEITGTKAEILEALADIRIEPQPGVYSAFLRIEDMLEIDWKGNNWDDGPKETLWEIFDDGDIVDTAYSEQERDGILARNPGYTAQQEERAEYETTDDAARQARKMGYDGVKIKNVTDTGPYGYAEDGDVYVVFDPANIKSADANNGDFDGANPDIRRSTKRQTGVNSRKSDTGIGSDEAYSTDLFGVPLEAGGPSAGGKRSTRRNLYRDDAPGQYATTTELVTEQTRTLGAARVNTPEEAAQALAYLHRSAVERFDALLTDKKGKPLAVVGAFKGQLAEASVYPLTLLTEAFRVEGAANIWFAHNHPSGREQLSDADINLSAVLTEMFRGSAIQARGLFAIGGSENDGRRWSFQDADSSKGVRFGVTSAPAKQAKVPVPERVLSAEGKLGPAIRSSSDARQSAKALANGESGVLLIDSAYAPVAFVPVAAQDTDRLRADGRMDMLWRATSKANAGAAIVVNAGAYTEQQIKNLAGFFNAARVSVLDVVDTSGGGYARTWAERGKDFSSKTFRSTRRNLRATRDYRAGGMSAAQQATIDRVFTEAETDKPLGQRLKETAANIKTEGGERFVQAVFDKFNSIKAYSLTGYKLARLVAASPQQVLSLVEYGALRRDPSGALKAAKLGTTRSLKQISGDLQGEMQPFLKWVAGYRAAQLLAEGRERLMTDADIAALKSLADGKLADGSARRAAYEQAYKDFQVLNTSVLDTVRARGLISQETYEVLRDQPYVPFYREIEDQVKTPRSSSALSGQFAFKYLKGGTQKINGDLLENVLANWGHLLSASAKNEALTRTLDDATKDHTDVVYKGQSTDDNVVKIMRDGKSEYWVVQDPMLLRSISSFFYATPGWVKGMARFKRILTVGVTSLPGFKYNNLIRDSVSVLAVSDIKKNPLANVAEGIKTADFSGALKNLAKAASGQQVDSFLPQNQTYADLLAGGGLMRFGNATGVSGWEELQQAIDAAKGATVTLSYADAADLWSRLKLYGTDLLEAYNAAGDASEQANRIALAQQLKAKGASQLDVVYEARDLLDFSLSGGNEFVGHLAQVVPFLNARLEGMYKLGRGYTGDPKRFIAIAGYTTALTLALYLAYRDDDDWKRRQEADRDGFWWFKIGETAFRLPKPFEIGAIATVAERTWEAFDDRDKDTAMSRYTQSLGRILMDNLALDPTPQIFKPLRDVYANRVGFTGSAIESQADQALPSELRYGPNTSELAKALGQIGIPDPARALFNREYSGLSPKQVDALLSGYFGSVAGLMNFFVNKASDTVTGNTRPASSELERLKSITGVNIQELPADQSRYIELLYQRATEVEQTHSALMRAAKDGDVETVNAIRETKGRQLDQYRAVEQAKRQMSKINQLIQRAYRSEADPETKRRTIQALRQRLGALAQQVEERLADLPE